MSNVYKEYSAPNYSNNQEVEFWPIYKNPTFIDIAKLKKCYNWISSSYIVRGIIYRNGDVYAWPSEWLHEFMEKDFPDMYISGKLIKIKFHNYLELKEIMDKLKEENWFDKKEV